LGSPKTSSTESGLMRLPMGSRVRVRGIETAGGIEALSIEKLAGSGSEQVQTVDVPVGQFLPSTAAQISQYLFSHGLGPVKLTEPTGSRK